MRDKISVRTVFVELAYCIISDKPGHRASCLDVQLLTIAIFAVVSSVRNCQDILAHPIFWRGAGLRLGQFIAGR